MILHSKDGERVSNLTTLTLTRDSDLKMLNYDGIYCARQLEHHLCKLNYFLLPFSFRQHWFITVGEPTEYFVLITKMVN
jgi:hypothetical protein